LQDVERLYHDYDVAVVNEFIIQIMHDNLKTKLENKLLVAEAVNAGYVGAQYSKNKQTQRNFKRWIRRIQQSIKKIEGRPEEKKTPTVWDRLKAQSRRRKRARKI